MRSLLPLFFASVLPVFFAGCVAMDPGQSRTLVQSKRPLKGEALAATPRRVAIVDRLPPVLYINNLEGNVWAGKSQWVQTEQLLPVATKLEETLAIRLKRRFAGVELRRMTLTEAHAARDVDWIILALPNGMVVPDFKWSDFAAMVLVGSASVAAGTPAPVAIGSMAGVAQENDPGETRPAYTLGTHAIYGTLVIFATRWEIREAGTWRALGTLAASSVVRLPKDIKDKRWNDWTAAEQETVWKTLLEEMPKVADEQLDKLGL